ncbi:hypothetical protein ACN27E_20430 [Mycobacterium sp. WMMD1722]|uniref:hypothetical protein n=1 Tax=Mycobacterium sp. WMMD1722 TaxID=3404117 RepID=UPI003BF48C99
MGRVYFCLVSWLLVACIPGLLMLATFGLERLESALVRDGGPDADVDEFLRQAAPKEAPRRVRAAAAARPGGRIEPVGTLPTRMVESGLPTMVYSPQPPNPQFRQTRHANRV